MLLLSLQAPKAGRMILLSQQQLQFQRPLMTDSQRFTTVAAVEVEEVTQAVNEEDTGAEAEVAREAISGVVVAEAVETSGDPVEVSVALPVVSRHKDILHFLMALQVGCHTQK